MQPPAKPPFLVPALVLCWATLALSSEDSVTSSSTSPPATTSVDYLTTDAPSSTRAPVPDGCDYMGGCYRYTTCRAKKTCSFDTECPPYQRCALGQCYCQYVYPDNVCFTESICSNILNCPSNEVCFKDGDEPSGAEYWALATPFALASFACFLCLGAGLFACKSLARRVAGRTGPRINTDGDSESISSMQRWINERLRDRPPRYDEMLVSSSSSPGSATTTQNPLYTEEQKPPSYELAMADHQTSSLFEQPAVGDGPPPPYTVASALQSDDMVWSGGVVNPCFEDDVRISPPPTAGLELAPPTSASSIRESSSSLSSLSFTSTSSSSSSSDNSSYCSASSSYILTISQAVAVQEMMRSEARS